MPFLRLNWPPMDGSKFCKCTVQDSLSRLIYLWQLMHIIDLLMIQPSAERSWMFDVLNSLGVFLIDGLIPTFYNMAICQTWQLL